MIIILSIIVSYSVMIMIIVYYSTRILLYSIIIVHQYYSQYCIIIYYYSTIIITILQQTYDQPQLVVIQKRRVPIQGDERLPGSSQRVPIRRLLFGPVAELRMGKTGACNGLNGPRNLFFQRWGNPPGSPLQLVVKTRLSFRFLHQPVRWGS